MPLQLSFSGAFLTAIIPFDFESLMGIVRRIRVCIRYEHALGAHVRMRVVHVFLVYEQLCPLVDVVLRRWSTFDRRRCCR